LLIGFLAKKMIRNVAKGMKWLLGRGCLFVAQRGDQVSLHHTAAGWLRRYYDGMMWSSLFVPWRGAKEDHIVKVSGGWDDDGTSCAAFQIIG